MNAELRESLYDLYEQGGLELMAQGARGIRQDLLIDLEMSEQGEVIHSSAVSMWVEDDEFDG